MTSLNGILEMSIHGSQRHDWVEAPRHLTDLTARRIRQLSIDTEQGILTQEEGSVQLTSMYQLVVFNSENIHILFSKTSYLNEEVSHTEPLEWVPCIERELLYLNVV